MKNIWQMMRLKSFLFSSHRIPLLCSAQKVIRRVGWESIYFNRLFRSTSNLIIFKRTPTDTWFSFDSSIVFLMFSALLFLKSSSVLLWNTQIGTRRKRRKRKLWKMSNLIKNRNNLKKKRSSNRIKGKEGKIK